MTLTAVDRNTEMKKGEIVAYPVAAANIPNGILVALNSAGYLISATGASTEKFMGVSAEGIDNSLGSAGDLYCKVYKSGVHKLVSAGLAITDAGKALYITDNQTVTLTANGMVVGVLSEFTTATVAWVDILLATKYRAPSGKYFAICGGFAGALTTGTPECVPEFELPVAYTILRSYSRVQIAPGSAKTLTFTISGGATGTFTVVTTAVVGSDEALNLAVAANTHIHIIASQTTDGAAAEGKFILICEEA